MGAEPCWSGVGKSAVAVEQIESALKNLRETHQGRVTYGLKFGKDDLVYGIQTRRGEVGFLKAFRDRGGGGRLLSSMNKPIDKSWAEYRKGMLASAAKSGQQVRFNLTGMKDIAGVLSGKGINSNIRIYNGVTAQELRYVRDKWSSFKLKPKFYLNDIEVKPPWLR